MKRQMEQYNWSVSIAIIILIGGAVSLLFHFLSVKYASGVLKSILDSSITSGIVAGLFVPISLRFSRKRQS